MSLRVTVVPASTNAGKATIQALMSHNKTSIHGIYRDISKAPKEFMEYSNFTASTGDVSTGDGLDFSGSDAVLYVPPPPGSGTKLDEFSERTATNIKDALAKASSVRRLLLFSAMGSQHDRDIGILRLNHRSDRILERAAPEVLVIRPGLFHEIWAHVFDTITADPPVIYSTITPIDHKVPMVSVQDVGIVCAERLVQVGETLPSNPYYFDLYGPRNYSAQDIKVAVQEATGKEVKLVAIEKEALVEFYSKNYPSDQVQWYVDMVTSALPGGIMVSDFEGNEHTFRGKEELVSSFRRMYLS